LFQVKNYLLINLKKIYVKNDLLKNIGVIIDTFTLLTEELQAREEDKTQFCFICGLSRDVLDKNFENRNGFASHIKVLNFFCKFSI